MYYAITSNQSPAQITMLAGMLLLGLSIFFTLVGFGNKVISALTNNKVELEQLQDGFNKQNEILVLQQKNMTENAEQFKTVVNSISDLFDKRLSEEYGSIRDSKEKIQQSLSAFESFLYSFNEHATTLVKQFSDTQTNHHQAQLSQIKRLEESLSKPLTVMESQFTASIEMQKIQDETSNKYFTDLIKQVNTTQAEANQEQLAQIKTLEAGLSAPLKAIEKQFIASVEAQDNQNVSINNNVTALIKQVSTAQVEAHQGQLAQLETLEAGLSAPLKAIEKQFIASIEAQDNQNVSINNNVTALIEQICTAQVEANQGQLAQLKNLEAGLSAPLKAIEKQFVASIEAQDNHSASIENMVTILIEKINSAQTKTHQGQEKLIEITELVINESANKFSKHQEQLLDKLSENIDQLDQNLDSMVHKLAKKLTDSSNDHKNLTIETNDSIHQQQTKLLTVIEDMSQAVRDELTANREEFSALTTKDLTIIEKLLKS
jgi:uncharacterized protein YifE (UPF0438 family)